MLRNQRVLIVEDSRVLASALRKSVMRMTGLEAVTAGSLAEARKLLTQKESDILAATVDLTLPDASGQDAVRELRRHGIPLIVFSGDYDEEVREWTLAEGVVDFVLKRGLESVAAVSQLVARLLKNQSISALVVDDSSTHRKVLRTYLERTLLHVHEAADGVQGLEVLAAKPDIQLVVTDYMMPNMDGRQFIRRIREDHAERDLRIIGLSAAEGSTPALLLKAGADDFLRTPFSSEEFNCRIQKTLEQQETVRRLRDAATTDFLTGLPNRRHFFEAGRPLFGSAKRDHISIAAGMMDIDHFKKINDSYGHDVGDEVLKAIAAILKNNQRETDVVARLGGEEFGFLLAGKEGSHWMAFFDRVRASIASEPILTSKGPIAVAASFGVCTKLGDGLDAMVKNADASLYQAKQAGRNVVVLDGVAQSR